MSTVYPAELFAMRVKVRMQSKRAHANPREVERVALDTIACSHSGAYAVEQVRRYLRDIGRATASPGDAA